MSKERLSTRKILGYTLEDVSELVTQIGHDPKALVLHCGTNNIKKGDSVGSIVNKFENIFREVGRRLPNTTIVYSSIVPREDDDRKQQIVEKVNDAIYTEFGHDIVYVENYDIWGEGYKRPDGVHLTTRGTSMLARNIKAGILDAVV